MVGVRNRNILEEAQALYVVVLKASVLLMSVRMVEHLPRHRGSRKSKGEVRNVYTIKLIAEGRLEPNTTGSSFMGIVTSPAGKNGNHSFDPFGSCPLVCIPHILSCSLNFCSLWFLFPYVLWSPVHSGPVACIPRRFFFSFVCLFLCYFFSPISLPPFVLFSPCFPSHRAIKLGYSC